MLEKIADRPPEQPVAILRLGFRPLFLAASGFSIVALITWAGVLARQWNFNPYGGSYWWHAHEMLFGFASTVVVGFLLTAVQNWTGVPGTKGPRLLLLVLLWFCARLLIFFNPGIPPLWVATIDLAFLPVAAFFFASSVLAVKQTRNLIFVPILLFMTVSNGTMHWSVYSGDPTWFTIGNHSMVLLITALMCVLGGRVFPMFTAGGTNTPKVLPWPWLEKISLWSIALIVIVFVFAIPLPRYLMAALFFFSALAHFIRWARWRFWITLKTPMVWSLHIAYFCIPVGLILFAAHFSGYPITFSLPLHVITVGAMGGMILSMMSRVALGHTGRPIRADPVHTAAFILIVLALLFRTVGTTLTGYNTESLILSAALWCMAYGLFFIKYLPILTNPRLDGRPG